MTRPAAGERSDENGAHRRRGSNRPAVGTYHQTLVLDLIRRAPEGLSRVELARRTGLSAQTSSNVTRPLTEEGLISGAGKVTWSEGHGEHRPGSTGGWWRQHIVVTPPYEHSATTPGTGMVTLS